MTSPLTEKLSHLLQSEGKFVDKETGILMKNKIISSALSMDKELLDLLIQDGETKQVFFSEIRGHWIFEVNRFIDYLQDRRFLSNSYTQFRNKIGLGTDNGLLSERAEVVLHWPFKDCVLLADMTKNDASKSELFLNETIAHTEIDKLFAPKVLTNFKKYTATGVETITDFTRDEEGIIKENLIVKGNNLLALHSLKKEFQGKVKLIYIDPPYNTGNDSFTYNDTFNHSSWLTFMRNRLEVAKSFLRDDGVIFVQCDDNEQAYLKVLMDEIFENNCLSTSIVVTNRGGRDYGGIAKTHEYLLIYSKQPLNELNLLEEKDKKFRYYDEMGGFNLIELRNRNILFNVTNRPNLCYPLYVDPNSKDENDLFELSLENKEGYIDVMPLPSQNVQTVWRWGKEKVKAHLNAEIKAKKKKNGGYMIVQKYRKKGRRQRSVWDEKEFVNEKGTEHIKQLFQKKVFLYPKSEHLIARILELGSNPGDIVMDFFLGSGTTCSTAHKLHRQYIGIEQMDYIETITCTRLQKVLAGEQGGISQEVKWTGGGSFLYCELKKHNQEAIERIQESQTSEDLSLLWQNLLNYYLLNYNVDIIAFDQNQQEFKSLNLNEQKSILISMLNKNQLYVTLSDLEDTFYSITSTDKQLNKRFYLI